MSLLANGKDIISALEDADHSFARGDIGPAVQQTTKALVLEKTKGWATTISAVQDWDAHKREWKSYRYIIARWEKLGADWHLYTTMRIPRTALIGLLQKGYTLPGAVD